MSGLIDVLGEEINNIVTPVSICMALTVILVRVLNPNSESSSNAVKIASIYYDEKESDSIGQKLGGSAINALIFAAFILFITFLLVLAFKYKCTKFIYAYMAFAGFMILFVLVGYLGIDLMTEIDVHIDYISYVFILFNFSVVGVTALFFCPAPISMKQSYLIVIGIVIAFIFTMIHEYTTWGILIVMALYDLYAVLAPGGPLKMLVELAQNREEAIPALVYEARPTVRRGYNEGPTAGGGRPGPISESVTPYPNHDQSADDAYRTHHVPTIASLVEDQQISGAGGVRQCSPCLSAGLDYGGCSHVLSDQEDDQEYRRETIEEQELADSILGTNTSNSNRPSLRSPRPRNSAATQRPQPPPPPREDPSPAFDLPDSIKLGLGDFIFYSLLVGRASMYSIQTVFATFISIIAGLVATLLLLAVLKKALPALPISIALGVAYYFMCRFVFEGVSVQMVSHGVFV